MKFYTNIQVSGNNILLKEVDNEKRKKYKVEYQPTLFTDSNKNVVWHTLNGKPVDPMHFGSIKEAREFVKTNNESSNKISLYGNTQFQYAFIADEYPEHEIQYNLADISIVTIDIECESESKFTQNASEDARERINVITLKDFNKDEYYTFTFVDNKIYNSMNRFRPKTKNIKHYEYANEREMLLGFLSVWRKLDPDVITGWNVRFFDIPYIYNRLLRLFNEQTARKLSPWNNVQEVIINFMNRDRKCYEISGISTLDYLQLYKKNIMDPRENYKLDYIAKTELKIGKIDWHEKYDTLREFYENDFQWFVEYNIQDVVLPELLEKKLKLIELVISVAYIAKVNYIDVLSQTRTWDMLIFNWLNQEKIVIPQKEYQSKNDQFVGAYVKEPKPGMYNNVVSFDVASLYPNIIRVLNIGPETKQDQWKIDLNSNDVLSIDKKWEKAFKVSKKNDCTLACNGVYYNRDKQSFYSRMVETLFSGRKVYQAEIRKLKKELESCTDPEKKNELSYLISKFDVKQKATKIMMNSLYGAFGNQYFRFYDLDNAEAVTMTGQFIIQFIQKGLNQHFNKLFGTEKVDFVIYSDTDSVYVNLDKLVNHVFKGVKPDIVKLVRFMDKVCKDSLEPEINKLFGLIVDTYINGMKPEKLILTMKREVIADRAIWSSKKHYILQVWNSEGDNYFECSDCENKFSGPSENAPPCNKCKSNNTKRVAKLKIMGFDMVKSSLPQFTKDAMKKAVNIVMTGTEEELTNFIEQIRLEFMKLPVEDISFPRGVNNLEKWESDDDLYSKGTPIQVKAVLLYNDYLKKLKLESKYPPIESSDKIKYVRLKQPNPIHDKVIAFNGKLPKEFDLLKYVDYEEMFNATLIKPLEKILNPIGWSSEKQYSIERFFK